MLMYRSVLKNKLLSLFASVVLLAFCCAAASPCVAQSEADTASKEVSLSREPVHITSDSLMADGNQNFVTFNGAVVAKQADMVIYADHLKVVYAADTKAMDRAEASGNVRVVRGDQVATADDAVYDSRRETIFLSGSPKVKQGESYLVGSEITIYLREQRSVVHGSDGGRVNAVFSPEDTSQ